MPFFNKRKDVVDLTLLKKKGLLKEFKQTPNQPTTRDYIDFSQTKKETAQNPFSFLDSLANSSVQSTPQPSTNTNSQDLNIKLENLEYKMERLTEKLALIENKLQNFEDKVTS